MTKLVALVVGASRGIGRQVAIDLAKNGYTGNIPECNSICSGVGLKTSSRGSSKDRKRPNQQCTVPSRPKFKGQHHNNRGS